LDERAADGLPAVFEDWLWHAVLPLIAYSLIVTAATLPKKHSQRDLFLVALASLILLFVGNS
jgi:hypothetical protein